jgi:hypothetical protein
MKRLTFRCLVAALTFVIGVSIAMLIYQFRKPLSHNPLPVAQAVDITVGIQ